MIDAVSLRDFVKCPLMLVCESGTTECYGVGQTSEARVRKSPLQPSRVVCCGRKIGFRTPLVDGTAENLIDPTAKRD